MKPPPALRRVYRQSDIHALFDTNALGMFRTGQMGKCLMRMWIKLLSDSINRHELKSDLGLAEIGQKPTQNPLGQRGLPPPVWRFLTPSQNGQVPEVFRATDLHWHADTTPRAPLCTVSKVSKVRLQSNELVSK